VGTILQAVGILLQPYRQRLLIGGALFLVGLALGLIYGWYIAPVEWTDAAPVDLRADYRANYLRLLADATRAGFLRVEESTGWLGQRWNPRDAAREIRRLAAQETDPARRATMEQLAAAWEQAPAPPTPTQGGIPAFCLAGLAGLILIGIAFFLLRRRAPQAVPRRLRRPLLQRLRSAQCAPPALRSGRPLLRPIRPLGRLPWRSGR
jgi:hypothetical protein